MAYFEQVSLQALNQEKVQQQFLSSDEVSTWDMIDMSALPATQFGGCCPPSEFGTQIDIQNRFWEHHPSSSVHHWDEFSRVRSTADATTSCLPSLFFWYVKKPLRCSVSNGFSFSPASSMSQAALEGAASILLAVNVTPYTCASGQVFSVWTAYDQQFGHSGCEQPWMQGYMH